MITPIKKELTTKDFNTWLKSYLQQKIDSNTIITKEDSEIIMTQACQLENSHRNLSLDIPELWPTNVDFSGYTES